MCTYQDISGTNFFNTTHVHGLKQWYRTLILVIGELFDGNDVVHKSH